MIDCDEPSARNCSGKNDCCIVSPVNSVSNGQQEIFFENQNNKIFLDKAALIQYDGSNMALIFFKNRIEALINECPSKGMKLMLLETACVKSASQIIVNLVADNPNLSELERVDMSLRRLELRFGTKGGFLGEPDVRRYRYGPKLASGSADAIRRFKVDLDNCALYASALVVVTSHLTKLCHDSRKLYVCCIFLCYILIVVFYACYNLLCFLLCYAHSNHPV